VTGPQLLQLQLQLQLQLRLQTNANWPMWLCKRDSLSDEEVTPRYRHGAGGDSLMLAHSSTTCTHWRPFLHLPESAACKACRCSFPFPS